MNMKNRSNGSTMVEVLVSLIVLSTGLLGMAGLQSESINNSKSSYYKTQASMLIADLGSRMRANGQGAASAAYVKSAVASSYTASGTSCTKGCSASQLAQADLDEWIKKLGDTLPDSEFKITKNATTSVYEVTLYWRDSGSNSIDRCENDTTTTKLCMNAYVKVCANGAEGGIEKCEV